MKILKYCTVYWILLNTICLSYASSMFDDNGQYSGSWKQMTNVSTKKSMYNSSSYNTSSWYASNAYKQKTNKATSFSASNYAQSNTTPFRYNTLNYTRIRKVKGGYGDYNAKCSDIGDTSFCH